MNTGKKRKSLIIKNLHLKIIILFSFISITSSLCAFLLVNIIMPMDPSILKNIDSTILREVTITLKTYNMLTIFIALLLAIFLVTIISKQVLRPIRALNAATKQVAQGDFNIKLPTVCTSDDELSLLTDNFNKMTKELSDISMLNNDFINNVSHEFKTPISSIHGFATVLLNTELTPEQRDYATIIATESTRLSKLTSNILTLSRLEHQNIIPDKKPFQLAEQIRHSVLLLQNEWTSKEIDIDLDLNEFSYMGNPDLVQQLWLNIIGNAIKFTPTGGKILIACFHTEKTATILINDTGIGMSSSVQKHIFDKFYQGDHSHSIGGNGLGLSLVKRIIELCNGTIQVTSQPNQGTQFTIQLPL